MAAVQQCLPDCLNGTINYNTLQCSCSCLFLKFVPTVGCVCADSTQVYDPCTKSCVPIFKPVPCQNGYPNPNVPGSCICNFLFLVYVENQGCICPASMNNAIFNPALGFCVCIAANAYMLNNVCTSCWLFSKPNAQQTTCICLDGYVQAGNSCIQKQNCLNGTLNQQTGVCYCTITGTYFLATVGCVCKDPHAYFNFGVCVCIKGYYSYKGLCT